MARQYAVDDSEWTEVRFINGYALFMGYLMMGVRGLGLLIITWTTVVLLGGFVSDLGKKDFWCLTGITLVQTAGVFNILLKEKISDTVHSWWGLFVSMIAMFIGKDGGFGIKRLIISYVLMAIQVLVFVVILCALGVVYILGMYISAGVSLWRLIEHDFGDVGGANQRPALQVLYILAVAQGVLFGYKTIYALVTGSGLANMFDEVDKGLIEEYIEETVVGCEKNPSFASGRNFVTYGVNLMMEAKSNEGFIAGIKVLGGAINEDESGAKVLAKYLITRLNSSSAIIHTLLETIGPRSPYSREIKEHVVRILDIIARCIPLEQFPQAIECLCSVVDTSEDTKKSRGQQRKTVPMHVRMQKKNSGNKFKDYERVELLEEYEKHYVERLETELDSDDDDSFFCNLKLCLLYQCMCGCKRKTVENDIKENRRGFDQLLPIAANIIYKLVTDKDNGWNMRTSISNAMLHKIAMFPTKLHRENHDPCRWYQKSELQMLERCWVLTEWLLVALTETSSPPLLPAATPVGEGRQRRRSEEIEEEQLPVVRSMDGSALGSSIKLTIEDSIESTIKSIFDCFDCCATQKRQAIQILLHLPLDMSFIIKDSESNKRRLSWILLFILCSTDDDSECWMVRSLAYRNKNCCDFNGIRRLAEEKLSEMLRDKHGELASEESARELQSVHLALGDLKSAFYADYEDISMRTHAIIIMEGLCLCRLDHTCYFEVEEFLVDAIPKVVKTLIRCGSKTAERQEQATDVEKGKVSQDNQDGCIDTQRLQKALASFVYDGYSHSNSTMRSKFKAIASKTCEEQGTSFEDFYRFVCQSIK